MVGVANWWSGYWQAMAPGQVNFLLFCAVWSLVALLFLAIVPWRLAHTAANHKFAILGVEASTMIFWFAGFIALAVFLSDRVCFGHVCSAAKAAAVFAAFEWYNLHFHGNFLDIRLTCVSVSYTHLTLPTKRIV